MQLFRSAATGMGKKHNFNIPFNTIFENTSVEIEPVVWTFCTFNKSGKLKLYCLKNMCDAD